MHILYIETYKKKDPRMCFLPTEVSSSGLLHGLLFLDSKWVPCCCHSSQSDFVVGFCERVCSVSSEVRATEPAGGVDMRRTCCEVEASAR